VSSPPDVDVPDDPAEEATSDFAESLPDGLMPLYSASERYGEFRAQFAPYFVTVSELIVSAILLSGSVYWASIYFGG
jgi:hypothetical protein